MSQNTEPVLWFVRHDSSLCCEDSLSTRSGLKAGDESVFTVAFSEIRCRFVVSGLSQQSDTIRYS